MGNKESSSQPESQVSSEDLETLRLKQAYKQLINRNKEDETRQLSNDAFRNLFAPCELFGDLLLERFCDDSEQDVTEEVYVAIGRKLLERHDPDAQMQWLLNVFAHGKQQLTKEDARCLLCVICRINWAYVSPALCGNISDADGTFDVVIKTMFGRDDSIDGDSFKRWCRLHAVNLWQGLQIYTATALLEGKSPSCQCTSGEYSEFGKNILEGQNYVTPSLAWMVASSIPFSYFPSAGTHGTAQPLPLMGMVLPGGWYSLYNSNHHGLSLNRFQHHVFEYKGSTVMFIGFEGHLYCVAVEQEWRDSTTRWGGVNSCLIQLKPEYKVLQSGDPMVYLNLSNRNSPRCLQIGKSPQSTVLEISPDFDKVKQYGVEYSLHNIEVWGCAGSTAREAQLSQKNWEKQEADKAKNRKLKIDKDEWKDSPDRQILELGGVTTEHAER